MRNLSEALNSLLVRLMIGSAIPLVLFAAVGLAAWSVASGMLEALRQEKHTYEALNRSLVLRQALDAMREAGNNRWADAYATRRTQCRGLIDELGRLVAGSGRQADILAEVREALTPVPEALPANAREALAAIARAEGRVEALMAGERDLLAGRREAAEGQARRAFSIIAFAVVSALVLTFALSYAAARSVIRPIQRLRDAAGLLVTGHIRSVPSEGPTEVADLIHLFNHMALTITQRTDLLVQQEERYRTYVGAVSHILWAADASGQVASDIPAWRAFTGQEEEQVRGLGWMDAVHPEDRDQCRRGWEAAVSGQGLFDIEFRLAAAAGEYRPFQCRAVPVMNADGSVREWIGTCTDISEKRQRDALLAAKEAAEAANTAKSAFLTRMSHELRTPLNAVIGMSKMLTTQRFGPLTAKQADYVQDITRSGEHLLAMINDILDISRVEAGKMEMLAGTFLAGEAVRGLASTLRPLAEARLLAVSLVPPEGDGPMETDHARFRQVLYNLLSNAIKFTPPGGQVSVRWEWVTAPLLEAAVAPEAEALALRVSVRDSGPGISPQDQQVVWDEFRQLHPASPEGQQGTGLGLALTRRLVALLGGAIGLNSAVGKGSTFLFVVPRKLPVASPSEETRRPTALVIEDDGPTGKLLCDLLREAGQVPALAADGLSGLEQARRLRPRLIVLDIRLPGMDGWHVLTELKADPNTAKIPVVIVTTDAQQRPAAGLSVREFFVKPVDRTAFLTRLRELEPGLFQPGRQPRVLVADDDPVTRKLLADLLAGEGLDVVTAEDGADALAKLPVARPDVVVLDLSMPNVDGFEVIEAIRSDPATATLPIMVVTGRDLDEAERQGLRGRIQALMEKHELTPERLRQHLQSLNLA